MIRPFSVRRVPVPRRGSSGAASLRPRADAAIPASPTGRVTASPAAAFFRFLKSAHGALLRFCEKCTVCAFAFPVKAAALDACALAALPCLADEPATRTVTLDVAAGGTLGAFLAAVVMWLNNQRKQQRQPPLGEDVARTYATKEELTRCQTVCRKDIDDIRAKIDENDRKAEDRARGTHSRIDKIYIAQEKANKALGMLIGIMVGKGIAPASTVTNITAEE